jgi:nitric oxide reductase activation protein
MDVFSFIEGDVDSSVWMQLLDLAKTLSREDVHVQWDYFDDRKGNTIHVSRHWDDYPGNDALLGRKTDIYLHAYGYKSFTNQLAIQQYLSTLEGTQLMQLMNQWLALGEEIRVGFACAMLRPGMGRGFRRRRQLLGRYFRQRALWHERRGESADSWCCRLTADWMVENEALSVDATENWLKRGMYRYPSQTASTQEWIEQLQLIQVKAETAFGQDMRSTYRLWHKSLDSFTLPEVEAAKTEDSLFRADGLENDDKQSSHPEAKDSSQADEKWSTWHRETKDEVSAGLRHELERGTKTDRLSEDAREGNASDGAMAIVQGRTGMSSNRQDYDDISQIEKQTEVNLHSRGGALEPWGQANRKVVYREAELRPLVKEDYRQYETILHEIQLYRKKLLHAMEQTLEQKKVLRRQQLLFGRLHRSSLTRLFTDPLPRLFYKKEASDRHWDARMAVLVDCSASMIDKMEEVHRGLVLFHEVLHQLQVPHKIVGFWEEADEVTNEAFPNYFQTVIDYRSSLTLGAGPAIMQLKPQQDNRDGYAIRRLTHELVKEPAAQRFLLVFSDGRPSAAEYEDEGILDTYQAVYEARRRGIEIIGIFLSNGPIKGKDQKAMENIYGRSALMLQDVRDLAPAVHALLQRLLLKSI